VGVEARLFELLLQGRLSECGHGPRQDRVRSFLLTPAPRLVQCPPCSPSSTSPAVQPPLPGDRLAMALRIRPDGKRPADFHVVRTVPQLTPMVR
jgi:hypothetical protein